MTNVLSRLFGRNRADDAEIWPAEHEAGAESGQAVATRTRPTTVGTRAESYFPGFIASAIGRATGRGERPEILRARIALRDAFTPSQPVTERENFAGRLEVLSQLIDIVEGQRSHVVIYGERGIGKTSLLHIFGRVARESQYIAVYDSCGAHSRFDEMFRGILREIPLLYSASVSPTSVEAERGRTLADRLGEGPLDARLFGELCAQITGTRVIIILDEYDRVEDAEFRRSVAELIKNLSDRAARVQLVISGVASNLQELVGYVPSIRRNVVGLPMPRLTAEETRALIALGEQAGGVQFEPDVIATITQLAAGSPYMARLLSHHASEAALDAGRLEVRPGDVPAALDRVVREAESRVSRKAAESAQRLAVSTSRDLAAGAARAANTPDGWFTVEDVAAFLPERHSAELKAALDAVTRPGEVMISEEQDGDRRYRFRDDALPMYLHMLIARADFATSMRGG